MVEISTFYKDKYIFHSFIRNIRTPIFDIPRTFYNIFYNFLIIFWRIILANDFFRQ